MGSKRHGSGEAKGQKVEEEEGMKQSLEISYLNCVSQAYNPVQFPSKRVTQWCSFPPHPRPKQHSSSGPTAMVSSKSILGTESPTLFLPMPLSFIKDIYLSIDILEERKKQ